MSLLMRALLLGYGTAAGAGYGLAEAGHGLWLAILAAWLGGAMLSLVLAGMGAWLWPAPEGPRRAPVNPGIGR